MLFDLFKNSFILIIITFCFQTNSTAQIPDIKNNCICIREAKTQRNISYKYRASDDKWIHFGPIRYNNSVLTKSIEAMAIDVAKNVMYATDGSNFGKIDIESNKFTLINSNLEGTGKIRGKIAYDFSFTDIDGLAYNPYTQELWATARIKGSFSFNDVLFKINPQTGKIVKGMFKDGFDFVEIEETYDCLLDRDVFDVDDIAINPYTNRLFAIQNHASQGNEKTVPGIITEINKFDGSVEIQIYDLKKNDIEGLGISGYGQLLGTTGDNNATQSSVIEIDVSNYKVNNLGPIDSRLPNGVGDFESFDCLSDYVDVALMATTIPRAGKGTVFDVGEIVEIELKIYNQGTIEINDLQIAMYLPVNVELVSTNWQNIIGTTIYTNTLQNEILNQGDVLSLIVKLQLSSRPDEGLNNIAFEISSIRNDIININAGDEVDLPDIDSKPDLLNKEINVKNNEINENGVFEDNEDEDEDDHDIATFHFTSVCPANLTLNVIDKSTYYAGNSIITEGEIKSNANVQMNAGKSLSFQSGFETKLGASLTVDIQPCQ